MHNDAAVDELPYHWPEFPALQQALDDCLVSGAAFGELWSCMNMVRAAEKSDVL